MAAPNIEMIAASLRSCSLGRGTASSPAPPPSFLPVGGDLTSGGDAAAVAADTTLELNSEIALPYQWEQRLDLKTGKIYYINWSTGTKSTEDPRKFTSFPDHHCSEDDADDENDGDEGDEDSSDDDDDDNDDEDDSDNDDDYGNCSSAFSSSPSSASSRDSINRGGSGGGGGGPVLVAAGCKVCMMYVMIPKRAEECPKCGGRLLHFGQSGS